ncbi:MAG: hypothetical protein ACRYF5_10205, partial [Janthinobacterium lividum]
MPFFAIDTTGFSTMLARPLENPLQASALQGATLWPQAWADLHRSPVIWQIALLGLCFLSAWLLARVILDRLAQRAARLSGTALNVEGFSRVVFPLLAWLFLMLARALLSQWMPVNLLRLALPLAASWALIRLVFYFLRRVFAQAGTVNNLLGVFEKLIALLVWAGVAIYITGLGPALLAHVDAIHIDV